MFNEEFPYDDRSFRISEHPATTVDYLRYGLDRAMSLNPTVIGWHVGRLNELGRTRYVDEFGIEQEVYVDPDTRRMLEEGPGRVMSLEEANERGKEFDLRFSEPPTVAQFEFLAEHKRHEREQLNVLSRAPGYGTVALGFVLDLAATAVDPINLASAFIPVVGHGRWAKWVATQGRGLARLKRGALEGAVGAAVVEPSIYFHAQQMQLEYGLQDSFLNLVFGTALGSGLHYAGGKVVDIYRRHKINSHFRRFATGAASSPRQPRPSGSPGGALVSPADHRKRVRPGESPQIIEAIPPEERGKLLNVAVKATQNDIFPAMDRLLELFPEAGPRVLFDRRFPGYFRLRSGFDAGDFYDLSTKAAQIIENHLEGLVGATGRKGLEELFRIYKGRFNALRNVKFTILSDEDFSNEYGSGLIRRQKVISIPEEPEIILSERATLGALRHELDTLLDALQGYEGGDLAGGYRYRFNDLDGPVAHRAALRAKQGLPLADAQSPKDQLDLFAKSPSILNSDPKAADRVQDHVNTHKDRDLDTYLEEEEQLAIEDVARYRATAGRQIDMIDQVFTEPEREAIAPMEKFEATKKQVESEIDKLRPDPEEAQAQMKRDIVALSDLDESILDQITAGKLDVRIGLHLGRLTDNTKLQKRVLKELAVAGITEVEEAKTFISEAIARHTVKQANELGEAVDQANELDALPEVEDLPPTDSVEITRPVVSRETLEAIESPADEVPREVARERYDEMERNIVLEEQAELRANKKTRKLASEVDEVIANEIPTGRAPEAGAAAAGRGEEVAPNLFDTRTPPQARPHATAVGGARPAAATVGELIEQEARPWGDKTRSVELGIRATHRVVTPDGSMEINVRPVLREIRDLRPASGKFQPRDRSRDEMIVEARRRSAVLDPEQLMPTRVSDSGPPIVTKDGMIVSGNGRFFSIQNVYIDPTFPTQRERYRAALGEEAADMDQPILVMEIVDELTEEELVRFADRSNRARIAAMSAPEAALRDVQAAGMDVMALYQGGDVTARQNLPFVRAFMQHVITDAERNAFSHNGELTKAGVDRLNAAILAAAYNDVGLLSVMLESTDDNIRAITGAYRDAAPFFMRLRADIAAGHVKPELDITPHLIEVAKLLSRLRSEGVKVSTWINQLDAFDEGDPRARALIRAFYNEDMSRAVSRKQITDLLQAYVTLIRSFHDEELTRVTSRERLSEFLRLYAEEARLHLTSQLIDDPTTIIDVLGVARRRVDETAPLREGAGGAAPRLEDQRVPDEGQAVAQDRRPVRSEAEPVEDAQAQPERTPDQLIADELIALAQDRGRFAERLTKLRKNKKLRKANVIAIYTEFFGRAPGKMTVAELWDEIAAGRSGASIQERSRAMAPPEPEPEPRRAVEEEFDDLDDLDEFAESPPEPRGPTIPEGLDNWTVEAFFDVLERGVMMRTSSAVARVLGVSVEKAGKLIGLAVEHGWLRITDEGVIMRVPPAERPPRPRFEPVDRFHIPDFSERYSKFVARAGAKGPIDLGNGFTLVRREAMRALTYQIIYRGEVVGEFYVRMSNVPEAISVARAQIDEPYQRRGLGTLVYDQIEKDAAKHGIRLLPQGLFELSDAGFNFWLRRNPDALAEVVRNDPMIHILGEDEFIAERLRAIRAVSRGPRFTFAGEGALNADRGSLATAQEMKRQRKSRDEIWRQTGWIEGVDGRWRFELDDSQAHLHIDRLKELGVLKLRNRLAEDIELRLGEVLHHPHLYSAYPNLENLQVVFRKADDIEIASGYRDENGITILDERIRDEGELFSILLHEIQHEIQHIEGFVVGGDTEMQRIFNMKALYQVELQLMEMERTGQGSNMRPALLDLKRALENTIIELTNPGGAVLPNRAQERSYLSLAGEVESRLVQDRLTLTAEERRTFFPEGDTPREETIVTGEAAEVVYQGDELLDSILDIVWKEEIEGNPFRQPENFLSRLPEDHPSRKFGLQLFILTVNPFKREIASFYATRDDIKRAIQNYGTIGLVSGITQEMSRIAQRVEDLSALLKLFGKGPDKRRTRQQINELADQAHNFDRLMHVLIGVNQHAGDRFHDPDSIVMRPLGRELPLDEPTGEVNEEDFMRVTKFLEQKIIDFYSEIEGREDVNYGDIDDFMLYGIDHLAFPNAVRIDSDTAPLKAAAIEIERRFPNEVAELRRMTLLKGYQRLSRAIAGEDLDDDGDFGDSLRSASIRGPRPLQGFYSPTLRAAEAIGAERGDPKQFLAAIENTPGVKKEELDWIGLREWIAEQKGPISKKELVDYIAAHQIELDEVKLTSDVFNRIYSILGADERFTLLIRFPRLKQGLSPISPAEREVLRARRLQLMKEQEKYFTKPNKTLRDRVNAEKRSLEIKRLTIRLHTEIYYESRHYEDVEIVHIRASVRSMPDGRRVLALEEIQSDLHQVGRKVGYTSLEDLKKRIEIEDQIIALNKKIDHINKRWRAGKPIDKDLMYDLHERMNNLQREHQKTFRPVADAPLKGDGWVELALKRMLLYAVENNFDGLVWARSDQAARAVLAPQQKLVQHYDVKIPSFMKKYVKKWGATVDEVDENLLNMKPFGMAYFNEWQAAADKIFASDEAMKEARPEILQEIRSLVSTPYITPSSMTPETFKFWTRFLEPMPDQKNKIVWITQAMRDSIPEGQPLFNITGERVRGLETPLEVAERTNAGRDPAFDMEAKKQVDKFIEETFPSAVKIKIMERLQEQGRTVGARWNPRDAVLWMASTYANNMRVFAHELVHIFRDLGGFTDAEWQILKRAARLKGWGAYAKLRDRYEQVYARRGGDQTSGYLLPELYAHLRDEAIAGRLPRDVEPVLDLPPTTRSVRDFEDLILEEVIAERLADHVDGKKEQGAIGLLFDRFVGFNERVWNWLSGYGFKNEQDVFNAIRNGTMKKQVDGRTQRTGSGYNRDDRLALIKSVQAYDPEVDPVREGEALAKAATALGQCMIGPH